MAFDIIGEARNILKLFYWALTPIQQAAAFFSQPNLSSCALKQLGIQMVFQLCDPATDPAEWDAKLLGGI
jgi:hypothetical protein